MPVRALHRLLRVAAAVVLGLALGRATAADADLAPAQVPAGRFEVALTKAVPADGRELIVPSEPRAVVTIAKGQLTFAIAGCPEFGPHPFTAKRYDEVIEVSCEFMIPYARLGEGQPASEKKPNRATTVTFFIRPEKKGGRTVGSTLDGSFRTRANDRLDDYSFMSRSLATPAAPETATESGEGKKRKPAPKAR